MFSSNTTQTSGGYQIQRSLRFNSADSAYLNRTPASAGNRKTWTWSGWVKRGSLGASQYLFSAFTAESDAGFFGIRFEQNDNSFQITGWDNTWRNTTQAFRDVSAWYHVVVILDTTQATADNRVRLYINGVEVTNFALKNNPSQNADLGVNGNWAHTISSNTSPINQFFNGYMTEVNFIDGQALTPSSFGEYNADTGVWQPKRYGGSYGTNGFYLNFSDNSNTTAATLGADYSGNGNNWTPNNFSVSAGAGNDSLVDVPTNWGVDTGVGGSVRGNYCTLNPLGVAGAIPTNGNLAVSSSSTVGNRISTFLLTSGKWYWEGSGDGYVGAIIGLDGAQFTDSISGAGSKSIGYWWFDGRAYWDGGNSGTGTTYTSSDVIGVALDMDIGNVKFYKNNTLIHDLTFGSGTVPNLSSGVYPGYNVGNATTSVDFNFGQRPFAYTAPSGFKALNTQNLPTPTIGATTATQAGKFFNPVLYTGNASTNNITGVGFETDFVWFKCRNAGFSNVLMDRVRGITNARLFSNLTDAESTSTTYINSTNSDGFQLAVGDNGANGSGNTYVAWNWKANGAGVTNTAGTITSTVSANTTSGFSVVTLTGINAAATVGHGLGAVPQMIIMKSRSAADNWYVYHVSIGAPNYLILNGTAASAAAGSVWNNTTPTSSVFSIGNNTGTGTQVAYCFAEVPGYSKFGSYTGNGSADGPFVFTGFRPAYVLIKKTSASDQWFVWDSKRSTINQITGGYLIPNLSDAEGSVNAVMDLVSNGFKIRGTDTSWNLSGATFVFAAFAEAPQKFSLAR
jgi:hypothetical protein